ncbi:hypothetical protein [Lysobacter enzymogenes]|uniref:Lipoprotein n=1 Tax=Lysobacter enzymogenes TaxID=69 RepID=A0A3N2RNE5_LYSEN|nr:hypothetical protein [Lysobacter enzymogenes]ROU08980.1 hypothetical protein D9T17_02585 [Lysobacter enzymogenes]
MTRKTKLMALCAFAFGLSFAASSAIAACNTRCFNTCKTNAINNCIANGGTQEDCNIDTTYYHCYRNCGCIIP